MEAGSCVEPFSKIHSLTLFVTCDVSMTVIPVLQRRNRGTKSWVNIEAGNEAQGEWVGSLEGGGRYRKERSRGGGGDGSRGSGKEAASLGSVTCLSVEPRSGTVQRPSPHAAP